VTEGDYFSRYDLPAALVSAAQEFDAWSRKRLLIEQSESTPNDPLYHYTDEAALLNILRTQRFWCFSHGQQKDNTEFEYALDIARDALRRVQSETGDFARALTRELLRNLSGGSKLSSPFEFYLASFSRHRDHGPQWKKYGKRGTGFAIGLSPSLFQPDKDYLYEEANKNLHVGRVIYGEDAIFERHDLVIRTCAEITDRIGRANQGLVEAVGTRAFVGMMGKELLASQMIWNCLTAKHACFADEREVRGIIGDERFGDADTSNMNCNLRRLAPSPRSSSAPRLESGPKMTCARVSGPKVMTTEFPYGAPVSRYLPIHVPSLTAKGRRLRARPLNKRVN
jgi:hypothetical protein